MIPVCFYTQSLNRRCFSLIRTRPYLHRNKADASVYKFKVRIKFLISSFFEIDFEIKTNAKKSRRFDLSVVCQQLADLSQKINMDISPVYTSRKIKDGIKVREDKPPLVSPQCVVYSSFETLSFWYALWDVLVFQKIWWSKSRALFKNLRLRAA